MSSLWGGLIPLLGLGGLGFQTYKATGFRPLPTIHPKLNIYYYQYSQANNMAPERSWLSVEWEKVCPSGPLQYPFTVD